MKATSQAMALRNQALPISVLVKEADSGKMPARITSIPPRATINKIWTKLAKMATKPRRMTKSGPNPTPTPLGPPSTRSLSMLSPKH